jgi:hypothetical protein
MLFLHFRFGYLSTISIDLVKEIDKQSSGIIVSQIVHSIQTNNVSDPGYYIHLKDRKTKDLTYEKTFIEQDLYGTSDSLIVDNYRNYYSSYIIHGRVLGFLGNYLYHKWFTDDANEFINNNQKRIEKYKLMNTIYTVNVVFNILPILLVLLFLLLNFPLIYALVYSTFLFLSPQLNIAVFSLYWSFGTLILPFAVNLYLEKYKANMYIIFGLNFLVFSLRLLCCFEYIIPVIVSALIPYVKVSRLKSIINEFPYKKAIIIGSASMVSFAFAVFIHTQNVVAKSPNVANTSEAVQSIFGRVSGNVKGNQLQNFNTDYQEFLTDYLNNTTINSYANTDGVVTKLIKLGYLYLIDFQTSFTDGDRVLFLPLIFFIIVVFWIFMRSKTDPVWVIQMILSLAIVFFWVILFLDHSLRHYEFTSSCFYIAFIYYFSLIVSEELVKRNGQIFLKR